MSCPRDAAMAGVSAVVSMVTRQKVHRLQWDLREDSVAESSVSAEDGDGDDDEVWSQIAPTSWARPRRREIICLLDVVVD